MSKIYENSLDKEFSYWKRINDYAQKIFRDVFGDEKITSDIIYDASADIDFEASYVICSEFSEEEILRETMHAAEVAEPGEFEPEAYIPSCLYCVLSDIQDAIDYYIAKTINEGDFYDKSRVIPSIG